MPLDQDSILDPAHEDDGGVENVGAAGVARPEVKDDTKPDLVVSEDGNILERGGTKYVRAEALHQERQARQQLQQTLSNLDPVMPEFEEFLRTRENRRTSVRESVAAGGGDDAGYLDEVATALGFFDETGKADHRRAQAHLNITRREAARETSRQVKPVNDSNVRDRAEANRQRARSAKFNDGQAIAEQKYMDQALAALPDEFLADSNIANITQVIAAGLEYLDLRKTGQLNSRGRRGGGREPMHVERGSGRFDAEDSDISALDAAAARARGKTPEQWAKLSKQANKSNRGSAVLEDIN